MAAESEADRAALLDDFGLDVIFSPGDSYPNRNDATVTIKGIFDNGFFEVPGQMGEINSLNPTLLARSSDTVDAVRNSMVEIAGAVYKVVDPEPDGTGLTVLMLEGPK